MSLVIRRYRPEDAVGTLRVFRSAIRTTAAADYSSEQIDAWAPHHIDADLWASRRAGANTAVAVRDSAVVGFTDVDQGGYVDMLFVDPLHARSGVATALLEWVLKEARRVGATRLTTHASITARPFFESQGFVVDEDRHPVVRGIPLKHHVMSRPVA